MECGVTLEFSRSVTRSDKSPEDLQRIEAVQHQLTYLGYGLGAADDVFGQKTLAAIQAF